jgi:hypothetical protein
MGAKPCLLAVSSWKKEQLAVKDSRGNITVEEELEVGL